MSIDPTMLAELTKLFGGKGKTGGSLMDMGKGLFSGISADKAANFAQQPQAPVTASNGFSGFKKAEGFTDIKTPPVGISTPDMANKPLMNTLNQYMPMAQPGANPTMPQAPKSSMNDFAAKNNMEMDPRTKKFMGKVGLETAGAVSNVLAPGSGAATKKVIQGIAKVVNKGKEIKNKNESEMWDLKEQRKQEGSGFGVMQAKDGGKLNSYMDGGDTLKKKSLDLNSPNYDLGERRDSFTGMIVAPVPYNAQENRIRQAEWEAAQLNKDKPVVKENNKIIPNEYKDSYKSYSDKRPGKPAGYYRDKQGKIIDVYK